MRAEVEAYVPTVGADTAAVLNRLLLGVPQFAAGGMIPARAGGTLGILGEAGQNEFALPEGKLVAMMNTAAGSAAAQVSALLAGHVGTRSEGGPLIGQLTVGDRRDLPAANDMIRSVAWRARMRAR